MDANMWGVLLVDKPEGPTSHDVVAWLRWGLGVTQVGHCGTLDPAASGLLVVCVGAATRLVPYLTVADKTYVATFVLGRSTTTDDRAGDSCISMDVPETVRGQAIAAVESLVGTHELSPPAFSAVKIDGERAHRRARRGDAVSLPVRPMTVHAVDHIAWMTSADAPEPAITATIVVSKGTYLRSLAVELGRRLDVPAHLGGLRRLRCGSQDLADPRVITGISVEALPDVPGRPPKVRLHWPNEARDADLSAARAALRSRLVAALIDPIEVLDLPVVDVGAGGPDMSVLTRLCHGQAVALTEDLAKRLPKAQPRAGEGLPERLRVGFRDAAGGLVIAWQDDRNDGSWLRPERVVTPINPAQSA